MRERLEQVRGVNILNDYSCYAQAAGCFRRRTEILSLAYRLRGGLSVSLVLVCRMECLCFLREHEGRKDSTLGSDLMARSHVDIVRIQTLSQASGVYRRSYPLFLARVRGLRQSTTSRCSDGDFGLRMTLDVSFHGLRKASALLLCPISRCPWTVLRKHMLMSNRARTVISQQIPIRHPQIIGHGSEPGPLPVGRRRIQSGAVCLMTLFAFELHFHFAPSLHLHLQAQRSSLPPSIPSPSGAHIQTYASPACTLELWHQHPHNHRRRTKCSTRTILTSKTPSSREAKLSLTGRHSLLCTATTIPTSTIASSRTSTKYATSRFDARSCPML